MEMSLPYYVPPTYLLWNFVIRNWEPHSHCPWIQKCPWPTMNLLHTCQETLSSGTANLITVNLSLDTRMSLTNNKSTYLPGDFVIRNCEPHNRCPRIRRCPWPIMNLLSLLYHVHDNLTLFSSMFTNYFLLCQIEKKGTIIEPRHDISKNLTFWQV